MGKSHKQLNQVMKNALIILEYDIDNIFVLKNLVKPDITAKCLQTIDFYIFLKRHSQ